jgi:hypothetical protein
MGRRPSPRNNSGSLAMFAATRRASPVADDEAGVRFLDGPRQREAAGHQRQTKISHTLATPKAMLPPPAEQPWRGIPCD